jgi:hypothetical protein
VPDATGLGLRAAARLLHSSGFRVQVRGWGRVVRMVPVAGASAASGSTVTLFAEARADR